MEMHSASGERLNNGALQRCRPGRSESKIRIKSDDPNDVRTHRRANQEPVHDTEKGKKQNDVRQEAAPDDEFRMPPEIQERIRTPAIRSLMPLQQIPFRPLAGQLVTLDPCHESAGNHAEKQQTTPYQIAPS